MSDVVSPLALAEEPDGLLARLQDNFTRQKRLVAAQKRKQADIELEAAAAYYSELPVTLELLSDQTAALFSELERLIAAQQAHAPIASKEALLLQRIRAGVNKELRQSMSFIEDGYQSGFEKMMRQSRTDDRPDKLPTTAAGITLLTQTAGGVVPRAVALSTPSGMPSDKARLTVREALSEHLSLMAESVAVLLQCETVRIYLYDEYENLRCAAQFPYRARRADPTQSSPLALMTVREVHETICRKHLAVNGTLCTPSATASPSPSPEPAEQPSEPTGVEDIRSCLIFPLLSPSSTRKAFGMIHAVNKHLPGVVDGAECGSADVPPRGFNLEDEVLMSNAARLLGTTLSRYPADAFTNVSIGESIRRRANPGDPEVGSLSAHLLPALHDDIAEAAEVGQEALHRTLPTLVHRATVDSIFASRSSNTPQRRKSAATAVNSDSSVSTVAFRLRCMNELWASCRDDNSALHQHYRTLEEETQKTRLLLRNVLDGVATARFMQVSEDVEAYLQTLEVYGRSERTERMAAFVADTMLALSQNKREDTMASTKNFSEGASSLFQSRDTAQGTADLRRLQHDHARLNTVTVASLHCGGPDGMPTYTSAPPQKREQVRFIEELRRSGANTLPAPKGPGQRSRKKGTALSPHNLLPRLAVSAREPQRDAFPIQRPFKM